MDSVSEKTMVLSSSISWKLPKGIIGSPFLITPAIFEVAGNFLRNAIDAKSGKIDKKLKMIELQLKKQKLDQGNKDGGPVEESDGFVISDRNELMKKLLKKD